MPELPEVETVRQGIAALIEGCHVTDVVVRRADLRWPVSEGLKEKLCGLRINKIERRAKYLLLNMGKGHLLIHLGMSGQLCVYPENFPVRKHDHIDIVLDCGKVLRFHDPRRFGMILWTVQPPEMHPRICSLGPEPLSEVFSDSWIIERARGRKTQIKNLIMDQKVVVGVGNIYASEALFVAGIRPDLPAGNLSELQLIRLRSGICNVLRQAIAAGGTTLKDFVNASGKPGYFSQLLWVYGRAEKPCRKCDQLILCLKIQGRSSFFCPVCQPAQ